MQAIAKTTAVLVLPLQNNKKQKHMADTLPLIQIIKTVKANQQKCAEVQDEGLQGLIQIRTRSMMRSNLKAISSKSGHKCSLASESQQNDSLFVILDK
jgi:hypothetical protein